LSIRLTLATSCYIHVSWDAGDAKPDAHDTLSTQLVGTVGLAEKILSIGESQIHF